LRRTSRPRQWRGRRSGRPKSQRILVGDQRRERRVRSPQRQEWRAPTGTAGPTSERAARLSASRALLRQQLRDMGAQLGDAFAGSR
jgi:hypothetical protein